jgi:DNA polymerase-1
MVKEKKASKQARLVLLDAHAIIHRAYHALPDFSSSKGEPTGALYGLISILLKVTEDLKPDYVIAARDLPGPTHRHELFEAYKATRVKADDELVAQLERSPEVFKAFGIPLYEAPGFEADDVIGTIVKKLSKQKDVDIIIASGDLDTLQLIDDKRVRVYTLRQGLSDTVLYDADKVRERFGFGPERIIDYKALRGDPSDNIPGIRGVGEKTATELIVHFGSVEDIYKALDKTPEKFADAGLKARAIELVKGGKKEALFSKGLASIRADAPVSFTLPKELWRLSAHTESIGALCDELEFRSLKERVRALTRGADAREPAEKAPPADISAEELRETSIALWLLHSDTTNPSLEDILRYAKTEDVEGAREAIFAELKKTGRLQELFDTIERPLIPVVERMNATGIYVDAEHLKSLAKEYTRELGALAGRVYQHAGHEFNISSPKQLASVLYDELHLGDGKTKKTAGGARTTRESELEKLAELHPIIADILAFRELQKLLSTYIEKMPALVSPDGRLHAEFVQAGTTTGRMSSQNPNLQNIPIKTEYGRRIRTAFAGEKGFVLAGLDYSQIELRIAAGLSGDKKLVKIFKEGGDVHSAVASAVFNVPPEKVDYEMRRRAKVINFGILYGMGVNALKANLGSDVKRDDAAKFLDDYFKNFSGLAEYIEETKAFATKRGFTETLFGRRRYFPALRSPLPNLKAQAERMAVNAPMQGTQSDIIKLAMVRADELIEKEGWRGKARLVLQVHDELVYEIAEKDAEEIALRLREMMESAAPSKQLSGVPIIAEVAIGKNWGNMKKVPRS